MNHEYARDIITAINSHDGPAKVARKKDLKFTRVEEVTRNGLVIHRLDDDTFSMTERAPGEIIVISSLNMGIAHNLGVLARLGFLYTAENELATPVRPDAPLLEFISHSDSPGFIASAVFRDRNPVI